MALSQLQCLDDNHVNPRTHESKPEFLYCEDQRLALEALLQDGREAFFKYLEARGLRGFLSDPELEALSGAVEPYDPGSEIFPESAEDDEPPLSLHYWPDVSDTSIPQMDLGWPDSSAYRGVTRTTVYSQPPLDGQAHIKEVVRKMIAQAQKVIAVVMDVFTDVDIFRDLLDAGFKRRVSIYILLDRTALPHFLSMCQRANMHAGHLKHLRVRCTEGPEFYTRSSTKVVGRMGHRFMFIDGDKAVSGSYNFTWMSSRLDRNLITVVTGQAVDAFDRLFHILYVTSRLVDLRQVAKAPEPEPDPLPQPTSVAPPSAAVARKLYNPKYALVTLGNLSPCPSPTPSTGHNSPKNNSGNPEVPDTKKRTRRRASKDTIQDAPPIHPGLINLEKAYLISYLPTWPEPDPPSDVIGFINIRDASKPNQVHLQRSEMFETSQAIRFSSPFNMPKEKLPEVAKPRLLTNKDQKMNKLQPAQDKTKAKELVVDRARAPEQNPPTSGPKCESDRDTTKLLNTEDKLHSSTPTNLDAGHSGTRHLNAHTTPQCSGEASTPNTGRPSHTTQVATTNNPNLDSLSGSKTKKEETSLNKQRAIVFKTHILELNSTLTSHLQGPTGTNTGQHTQRLPPHTDSHTQAAHTQPKNSSEMTPNIQTDTVKSSASPSSTSLSENKHVSNTKSMATSACAPLSSIPTLLTSSSTTLNPPLPSSLASSSLTSPLPIPKPRTLQLVVTSDGQKLPEFSIMRRQKTSAGLQVLCNEPAVQKQKSEKESETVTELHNNSGSRPVVQKDADRQNIGKIRESPQQKQSGTSQKTKDEETVGLRDDRAGMHLEVQSEVLITDAPKSKSANIREISPKDVEAKTLTSIDCKLTPQTDCVATVQAGIKATERALTGCEVPNENNNNVTQHKSYYASALERQRKLYYTLTPKDIDVLVTVDSLKGATHTSVPASHTSEDITGDSTHTPAADAHGQQGYPSFTPAHCTDSMPNTAKHNTHSNFQELISNARASTHTPEKSLRLHLPNTHMPDLRSQTPEREAWSVAALVRTPTPEGFLPCTPTPDSRTHTPDLRSYTPDFRTPTSDGSDGYFSARADSALSTASEEYYECTDSPLHEPVFDLAAHRNHGTTEDHVSFTHTSTPNTTTLATSPIYMKYNTGADTLVTTDRNNSSSETQTLSGPTSVSSLSSLPEEKVKTRWEEEAANEENVREVDEKGRKLSVAEGRTEGDPQGTQRKDSEEAKRIADPFKQVKDLMDTVEKNKEAQPQSLKRKMVPNQSAAERLVDRGVTLGELTNERAEPKRLSTGDLKPKKAPSEGERPDKEKAVDRAALGPSGVEKRGRLQSSRETEGQKVLHTPPRTPRGLQQDSGVVPPSRPSKSPRPLSGAHPSGSRQPNQTESKVLQGQGLNTTSSPRKQPSRLSPPAAAGAVGLVAGRKQAELVSRQPPAAQGRAKTAQSPNQHPLPKPPASFLHTHSNALLQLHPHSQNQAESAKEVHSQEDGKTPFSFTLSKLYSLKDLKMSKLPAQSKRGSTSSPVQGHKSTS